MSCSVTEFLERFRRQEMFGFFATSGLILYLINKKAASTSVARILSEYMKT